MTRGRSPLFPHTGERCHGARMMVPRVCPVLSVSGPPHRQHRAGWYGPRGTNERAPHGAGVRRIPEERGLRHSVRARPQDTVQRGRTPGYADRRGACATANAAGRRATRVSGSSAGMACPFLCPVFWSRVRVRTDLYRPQLDTRVLTGPAACSLPGQRQRAFARTRAQRRCSRHTRTTSAGRSGTAGTQMT